MPIRGEGLQDDGDADANGESTNAAAATMAPVGEGGEGGVDGTAREAGRVVYVLHPNCAVEEM